MTAHQFRFAAELHRPFDDRSWADSVRELEALGYSTMFVPDHFSEGFGPIAAMATAAAATTTLNVGSLVLDCDFRHPAVLARELSTIDQLSEGRLEIGLGAGWKRLDYDQSGIPMDPPKVRVDRMIEHTQILKRLLAGETVTFAGDHYSIAGLDLIPAAHRREGPPILIGGGARRVLRFAGATADIVGVNASIHSGEIDVAAGRDALPERIDEKVEWVRAGAGDRFDQLEINAWLAFAEVTDDTATVADAIATLFETEAATLSELAARVDRFGRRDRGSTPRATRTMGLLVPRHPGRPRARVRSGREAPHGNLRVVRRAGMGRGRGEPRSGRRGVEAFDPAPDVAQHRVVVAEYARVRHARGCGQPGLLVVHRDGTDQREDLVPGEVDDRPTELQLVAGDELLARVEPGYFRAGCLRRQLVEREIPGEVHLRRPEGRELPVEQRDDAAVGPVHHVAESRVAPEQRGIGLVRRHRRPAPLERGDQRSRGSAVARPVGIPDPVVDLRRQSPAE